MGLAIIAFCVLFLLAASGGLLLFYRDALPQRIAEAINPRPKQRTLLTTIRQTGFSIGGVVEHMERVLPKSQAEISIALQRLTRGGVPERVGNQGFFYGCKVLTPLVLLCVICPGQQSLEREPVFCVRVGTGVGVSGAPDFWLGRMIKTRQKKMQKGLPDVLDLLVICIEAGLSLDQATARTAGRVEECAA